MSNHFRDLTHFQPLTDADGIDDLVPPDDTDNEPASDANCDCPFPWWWVVLAGVAGGGLGYAAGKRKKNAEDALELEP